MILSKDYFIFCIIIRFGLKMTMLIISWLNC